MSEEKGSTQDGLPKYGGKWHSVVPVPEITVDKKKIHEEMKKNSQRKTVRVTSKLP